MGKVEMMTEEAQDVQTLELSPQPAALPAVNQQPTAPGRQLSVVEYAMQHGASAADVRALVELQIQMDNHKLAMLKQQDERDRELRKVAGELAFRAAFAAFRGENITVPRSKHVDRGRAGSFMQAEYEAISRLLSPALSRHGFSFSHDPVFGSREWPIADSPHNTIGWVTVTCYLHHSGGHTDKVALEGPPDEQSANTPVQNMQSTASFLKRQSLLAITGTATGGEDDEGKMARSKGATGDADSTGDDALIEAGRAASLEGMKPLTAWWGALTAHQRGRLGKEFASMRKAAQQAENEHA